MGKATMIDSVPLEANFAFGMGAWTGKVAPFKDLCATTHPQFLVLELRASTGACLGRDNMVHVHVYLLNGAQEKRKCYQFDSQFLTHAG